MRIQQKLPYLVNLLIILALAFVVAQFITARLHTSEDPGITTDSQTQQSATTRPRFSSVALFGKAKQKIAPKPEKKKRVKAKLDLKLLGVVTASGKGYQPTAVISHKNDAKAYAIGDTIMDGVKLLEVHPKSVVVSHAGLEKVIELEKNSGENIGFNAPPAPSPGKTASVGAENFSPRLTKRLSDYKQKLKENPMSLINLFTGEPVWRNGQMIGVRVRPGSDRELFKALQLKPKDIIMSVNDIPVTNIDRMNELMDLVENAQVLNLTIERNKDPINLSVSLPSKEL